MGTILGSLYGANIVFADPDGHRTLDYLIELIERETITVIAFCAIRAGGFTETLKRRTKTNQDSQPSCHGI